VQRCPAAAPASLTVLDRPLAGSVPVLGLTPLAAESAAVAALRARAQEHNAALPDGATAVDLYARLSQNPDGKLEKIETQLEDGFAVAVQRGWRVSALVVDNSLSAWNPRVRRPGWEALLDRLESATTGGVVAYHWDRMMRRPQDLGRLLDVVRDRSLEIATAHGSRNLQDPNDQFIAWVEVAHAQRSSTDTSRRLRRRFQTMREDGVVRGGPRWFGFPGADRSVPKDEHGERPAVPAEQVQRERDALREASEGIAAGTALLAEIAAQWNAEGLRTATGGNWDGVNVRQVLSRPRNAGLIYHEGNPVGRVRGEEPIVDEELWQRVQAVFASRRRGRAPDTRNYVATGLIQCGQCGHTLTGRPRARFRPDGAQVTEYYCHRPRGGCGRVAVDARGVEAVLRTFVAHRLSDPAHAERLAALTAEETRRAEEIETALGQAREIEERLSEKLARGEMSLSAWEAAQPHAHARVAKLEAERDALAVAAADAVPEVGEQTMQAVLDAWDADEAAQGTERRGMLVRALRAGWHITVAPRPHQKGRPVFDPSRVEICPTRKVS